MNENLHFSVATQPRQIGYRRGECELEVGSVSKEGTDVRRINIPLGALNARDKYFLRLAFSQLLNMLEPLQRHPLPSLAFVLSGFGRKLFIPLKR
jgi:hypothetical protein